MALSKRTQSGSRCSYLVVPPLGLCPPPLVQCTHIVYQGCDLVQGSKREVIIIHFIIKCINKSPDIQLAALRLSGKKLSITKNEWWYASDVCFTLDGYYSQSEQLSSNNKPFHFFNNLSIKY